mmetsp:Transcript_17158/g.27886  ORF Transcript_17158/g.27886 Transcript_17158/m.27886 type:complete len:260 (+) Transcript_17158:2-781(+)
MVATTTDGNAPQPPSMLVATTTTPTTAASVSGMSLPQPTNTATAPQPTAMMVATTTDASVGGRSLPAHYYSSSAHSTAANLTTESTAASLPVESTAACLPAKPNPPTTAAPSAKKKKAKKKPYGRKDWDAVIRSYDNVANGYIKLDPKGGYIDCGCCGIPREPKQIAMRRPFDPRNFNDHTQCKTHREKLAMAKHHDMVVARDSNKARQEGREPQAAFFYGPSLSIESWISRNTLFPSTESWESRNTLFPYFGLGRIST